MKHLSSLSAFILFATVCPAQLNGTYTIGGSSPDYATITAAVNDLMTQGAASNVTFEIRPGIYTGQYMLAAIPGTPGTIIFRSESDNAEDVVLEFEATDIGANYIFQIDGTDNLFFGDLTFHALGDEFGRAVHLFNDANLVQFINCVFIGTDNPSTSGASNRILLHNDQVDFGNTENPDDLMIDGCTFMGGAIGAELRFSGLGGVRSEGLIITDNTFKDQVVMGLNVNAAVGQIGDNRITTSVGNDYVGLRTSYFDGGSQVRRNVIQVEGIAAGAIGMDVGNTQFTTGNMISNNMITVEAPGECMGLAVVNLWDMKIVHNSVAVLNGTTSSKAFYHYGNFADGQNSIARNNLFINYTDGPAFQAEVHGNIATEDHNDLYGTGSVIARVGTDDYATIAGYQGGTGDGFADVWIDPAFPALPDLHLNSCVLDGLGEYFFVVAGDIDGNARGNPICDMGADEFTFSGSFNSSVTFLSTELPYTLTAGNGSNYQWNTGASTQSITNSVGGLFGCTFTDVNGCAYTTYFNVTVDFSTTVDEASAPDLRAYPVPTDERLFVQGLSSRASFQVFGADGRVAWSGMLDPLSGMDVSALMPGAYVLHLNLNGEKKALRFVKE